MKQQCRQAINEINAVLDKYGIGLEIYVDRGGKVKADIWDANSSSESLGVEIDTINLQEFKGKITLLTQTLPSRQKKN